MLHYKRIMIQVIMHICFIILMVHQCNLLIVHLIFQLHIQEVLVHSVKQITYPDTQITQI